MEARVIVACLFLVAVVGGEQAPTGMCRANERFLECGGCQKTCRDPAPNCAAVCRTGCYCEEGQVRNKDGLCVNLSECPPISAAYKQDTTEPRPNGGRCPENQEYRYCEPCNKTCDNRNPICPAQCIRGCFCKTGLLRDRDGSCVAPEKCSSSTPTVLPAVPAPNATNHEMTCKEHQVYKQCETQEKTCSDPNPQVPSPCVVGCYCVEGYVKAPNRQCVRLEECPKGPKNNKYVEIKEVNTQNRTISQEGNGTILPDFVKISPKNNGNIKNKTINTQERMLLQESNGTISPDCAIISVEKNISLGPNNDEYVENKAINTQDRMHSQGGQVKISPETPTLVQVQPMFSVVIYDSQPSHHDPSVEDCAPDEEYFSCGWCEPSCSDPSPSCPNKVCIRGCLCRPPLLRHHTGHCVDIKDCFPEKCSNPNEEYVCLFGCELRCDGVCQRPRYCVLGCYCRIGLLRDNNGLCVIKERCSNSTKVQGTAVNYDRSSAVNYHKSPSVNHHRDTTIDLKKILGNDETFILVPVM